MNLGVKSYFKKIDLSEFFESEVYVVVRPLSQYVKSVIQEKVSSGTEYKYDERGRANGVSKVMNADDIYAMFKLKLEHGVIEHNINDGGQLVPWNETLWNELEKHNPKILETIADAVQEITWPSSAEGSENPTSATPKKKK